ncbi:unnamed protein product [Ectocarpus sp. 12 AP-2014]
MEDSSPAASSETLATTTTGNMSLLEVQSEQLAIKLQQEAFGGDGDPNSTDGDAGVKDDESGAGRQQWPIPRAQDSSSFSQTPNASQGAWGVPGRSAADLLRSANASAAPTPASQEQSSPPAHTTAARSSSAAAVADLAVVPLSAESIGALVGMGIDQAWAAAALRRCGGNDVSRAVEYCFSHDMGALAEEDARAFEAATTADASQQPLHQDNETQHQQPDADSDMAFALALDQEERRLFEARRSTAAATLATEQGTFGSKVRVAAAAAAAPAAPGGTGTGPSGRGASQNPPQRWGVADAEGFMDDGGEDLLSQDTELREDGDEGDGLEEGEGGGGFRAVPGGGRRKGKMPLFKNSEGEVVSKHDAVICGRMNARDASNLEGVGDLTAAGVRLGNRTFNSLKRDIRKKKEKGMAAGGRVEQATRSTQEGVMDPRTRLLLFKMQNNGTLLEVHGMVKTGKEAHVYHALAPEDPEAMTGSRGVALKIFKTTLSEFGNRAAYVDGDPRYGNMRFNKQSREKMFAIWAKKEHRNLLRLHRAGIPCPEPIKQREHTLVLSFIGKDHWPAPQLREIDLSKANWRRCYAQVLELARLMFLKCHLVHADLSEYNVLYHEKVCHVIDVGQAVDTGHPKARELLRRDMSVVESFFRRKGVTGCLEAAVAERFVVAYRGPSSCDHDAAAADVTVEGGGGTGEEERPLSGVEVILELMETPGINADERLQAACAAAEPWASRHSRQGSRNDSDENFVSSEESEHEDDEEGGSHPDCAEEEEGAGEEAGWTMVDVEREEGRGDKVELSERERARTAAEKEALKAGIF